MEPNYIKEWIDTITPNKAGHTLAGANFSLIACIGILLMYHGLKEIARAIYNSGPV